ncbi:MAG: phage integrase N-terminal SAM-like domain-containing protein [SAR324 cluster bacterium]|nr:phage integrase N-terminal SAM-like domain-containing protein [SAR324 cluster bacterium]
MNDQQQSKFKTLYQSHQLNLKLQGMSPKTICCYSLALRRVADYFDRCPDDLTQDELKIYFSDLLDSHSWSTMPGKL